MRVFIGIGIVITSILVFGWWGLLSLIIALPFIGWADRHKGPFPTNQNRTSNYGSADILASEIPTAFRSIQGLLVDIEKNSWTSNDLHVQLHLLRGTLRYEKYGDSKISDKDMLFEVISRFSSAFPNWQREYVIILEAIEREF